MEGGRVMGDSGGGVDGDVPFRIVKSQKLTLHIDRQETHRSL